MLAKNNNKKGQEKMGPEKQEKKEIRKIAMSKAPKATEAKGEASHPSKSLTDEKIHNERAYMGNSYIEKSPTGLKILVIILILLVVALIVALGFLLNRQEKLLERLDNRPDKPAETSPPLESVTLSQEQILANINGFNPEGREIGEEERVRIEELTSHIEKKEAFYVASSGEYYFAICLVTNHNDANVEIAGEANFKHGDKLVGVSKSTVDVLGPGETSILTFYNDAISDCVEIILEAADEDYYKNVLNQLEYEASSQGNKVIVKVTNNGPHTADFLKGHVVFFSQGIPVDVDSWYMVKEHYQLAPGKKESQEFLTRKSYDSFEVYWTGRATE